MRYLPFRSLFDPSLVTSVWDDQDWMNMASNDGLNVYEEDDNVVVQAALPGIAADKIRVTYENGMMRISGENEENNEDKRKGRKVHSWNRKQSFTYIATLPRPIDTKSVDAEVKDGVITIKAKVAEESKAKEIPVRLGK